MKRYVLWTAVTTLALVAWARPAATQPSEELKALRNEVETLKQGQAGIKKDLEEIKGLLRARPAAQAAPAPPPVPKELALDLNGVPVKGSKSAKVAMVEYSDFQ